MTEPLLDAAVLDSFGALAGDDGANPTAEIVATFRRESVARLARLCAAIDRQDLDVLVREAHAIRGGAGIVGAVRLASSAHALERLAVGQAHWPELEHACRVVSTMLSATLAALDPARPHEPRLGVATLRTALADRVAELETALSRVKQLHGLLPICSYCKHVRTDGDYWRQVEHDVAKHSDLQFSRGICPACYAQVMAELDDTKEKGQ